MENKKKMIIEGYAIVYNQSTILYESDGIKFYETISPEALVGADISDVLLNYNHSDEIFVLAGTRNGSLQLINDSSGLKIRAELSNTTAGRDVYELIKTRLIDKMSFAFTVKEDYYDKDNRIRTIKKINKLWDCALVSVPAYPQTSVKVIEDVFQINEFNNNKKENLRNKLKIELHSTRQKYLLKKVEKELEK